MIVRPLHPCSVILGAEVEQQQTAVSWCSIDHVLEECVARAVEPVKILEEEDGWLPGAASAGEPADDVEELTLPRLRPHGWHGLLGIGHPQEVEHHPQPFAEILVEAQHPPGDLVARGLWWVLLRDPEVTTNERKNRGPRHRLPVGDAVSFIDLDLPPSAALHKLVAKAALAGSRI